ncbi:DUF456 domain-containing protein [Deinococcus misasensis]|uniref:DUF456 domain-containing protein n=1 Tax=Deinococcus misasensis TaxID=392413 RepID=UPI00054D7C5F|nr:DUF456 family protein [Deinococcus misasensis]
MEIVVFVLVWLIGLVGTFIPVLPATFIVWLGALIYAYMTGFAEVTWAWLIGLALLALLTMTIDNIASAWGTKKYGGTNLAMLGAVVGGIVGIFLGPLGLFIGPFAGAFGFELLNKQPPEAALKSAWGAVVGLLAGIFGKFIMHLIMGGLVLWKALT